MITLNGFGPFFPQSVDAFRLGSCILCGRGGASTRRVILWVVRAPAEAITRFQETMPCRNMKQLICGSAVGSCYDRTDVHMPNLEGSSMQLLKFTLSALTGFLCIV